MYNTTVSSSFFEVNPLQPSPSTNIGPQSLLWTTSGSKASNPENYWVWNPDGSDSNSYQNPNTPFLIERGDVIRVEGVLNTINTANISQSTTIIEDFTVEEIQDYFYPSSFASSSQDRNGITGSISYYSPYGTGPQINQQVINPGFCKNSNGIGNFWGYAISVTIGSPGGVTTTNPNSNGGTIRLTVPAFAGTSPFGWSIITLGVSNAGNSFIEGEEITIPASLLSDSTYWTTNALSGDYPDTTGTFAAESITIALSRANLINADFNNNFTFSVDINASANIVAATQESGSQGGYYDYERRGSWFFSTYIYKSYTRSKRKIKWIRCRSCN
jgi:hypothetical protein